MDMKLQSILSYLLTENIGGLYEDVLEIANYPEGFDINQFKDLPSYAAKARYLRSHGLDKLGAGSSRAAFIADNDTVIKVAKNKKGLAQNRVEANISSDDFMPANAPLALVKDHDPDYVWIESERARRAKPTDFQSIVGYPMKDVIKTVRELVDNYKDKRQPVASYWYLKDRELFDQLSETPFITDLVDIIVNHDLEMGDIDRISSWGVVNRNGSQQLVLIDYGLDDQVWKQHYARR